MAKHSAHNEHTTEPMEKPSGYRELQDINPSAVYKFLGWLALGIALAYCVAYLVVRPAKLRNEGIGNPPITHTQQTEAEKIPPAPRLQLAPGQYLHPLDELRQYKDSLYHILTTYAWIDKSKGTVRIPIELAKTLVAQEGLPTSAVPGQPDPTIIMVPEASSSGRTLIALHQRIPVETKTVLEGGVTDRHKK